MLKSKKLHWIQHPWIQLKIKENAALQHIIYVFVLFQVCQKGECTDSICLKYDLSSCFLTSDKTSDKRRLCDLACQYNNTCVSTKELAEKYPNLGAKSLSLRPGSPCDEYQVWKCFLSPFKY